MAQLPEYKPAHRSTKYPRQDVALDHFEAHLAKLCHSLLFFLVGRICLRLQGHAAAFTETNTDAVGGSAGRTSLSLPRFHAEVISTIFAKSCPWAVKKLTGFAGRQSDMIQLNTAAFAIVDAGTNGGATHRTALSHHCLPLPLHFCWCNGPELRFWRWFNGLQHTRWQQVWFFHSQQGGILWRSNRCRRSSYLFGRLCFGFLF